MCFVVFSGDGHLELSLPSLEITNLSVSDRPSPSASPELKSSSVTKCVSSGNKIERDEVNLSDNSSRAQMIHELKVQLTGTDVGGFSWQNPDHRGDWDQHIGREKPEGSDNSGTSYESASSSSNSRAVTPDVTPTTSPESSNKFMGQLQKHLSVGTILSPGIPGLLPPLISSTPYVGGPVSRIHHGRSFSENDAVVAKQREEPLKQQPFRPWESNVVKPEVKVKIKGEIGEKLKMQRTSSLTTEPPISVLASAQQSIADHQVQPQAASDDLDPLRKAMVFQHSKLVEDLSWLQQHRPNDPQVFMVCRDYSAQVDHLERLRYQALALATACPESIANIDTHYDQQRLELLRSTTHRIASLKVASFQYTMPYHVPDIPYFQPISTMCPQLPQVSNYYHGCQPELKRKRRSDSKYMAKMECHFIPQGQESPVELTSGSTSSDSAYHSLSNNSASSDTSTSSTTSSENLKLIEHVEKLCPQAPYENGDLKPKFEHNGNNKENRLLNRQAVRYMEYWYNLHFDHPYPSDAEAQELARKGGISVAQVKKWMANKRVRSYNTLSFNGSIHPRKLKRLRQQQEMVYSQLSRANVRYNPIAVMPRM